MTDCVEALAGVIMTSDYWDAFCWIRYFPHRRLRVWFLGFTRARGPDRSNAHVTDFDQALAGVIVIKRPLGCLFVGLGIGICLIVGLGICLIVGLGYSP